VCVLYACTTIYNYLTVVFSALASMHYITVLLPVPGRRAVRSDDTNSIIIVPPH